MRETYPRESDNRKAAAEVTSDGGEQAGTRRPALLVPMSLEIRNQDMGVIFLEHVEEGVRSGLVTRATEMLAVPEIE